jgi:hypothetical protein
MNDTRYDTLMFGLELEGYGTAADNDLQEIAASLGLAPFSADTSANGFEFPELSEQDLLALDNPFYFHEQQQQQQQQQQQAWEDEYQQQQQQQHAFLASQQAGDMNLPADEDMLLAFQLERLQALEQQGQQHDQQLEEEEEDAQQQQQQQQQQQPPQMQEDDAEEVSVDECRSVCTLTEFEIGYMSYQQLMQMLGAQGASAAQVDEFKALRRKVRNRKCARECSTRKRRKAKTLAVINGELEERVGELETENGALRHANISLTRAHALAEQEIAELRRQVHALSTALTQQTWPCAGAA